MKEIKNIRRQRRHLRIRKRILGTEEKPRLTIFKSIKNIYASFIVDEESPNKVIATVSSLSQQFKKEQKDSINGGNVEGAKVVGTLVAEKAKELGISEVVFDRAGYKYTGRVKAVAELARKGGLKF
jgi:large subunit ribosomal protein L18